MKPLPAAVVREAVALMQAGHEQQARDLIAAQPGLSPDEAQRIGDALRDAAALRQQILRRNRAVLGASVVAVLAVAVLTVVAKPVSASLGMHGVMVAAAAVMIALVVALAGFATGWKLFGG